MALIDAALGALRALTLPQPADRSGLATPASTATGAGGGGGSASVRSALSVATTTCAVRRQDIVVAAARAREQVAVTGLADRAAIDALLRQLRADADAGVAGVPPPPPPPASFR